MSIAAIGIDLGGTRIKGIALDSEYKIIHQLYTPTNDEGDDTVWKQAVAKTVEDLQVKINTNDFVIGISAPGLPNEKNSAIAYMPSRLHGLENFDWSSYLHHTAYVLNDAVSALVAEAKLGAASGKKHAALFTLGTGVGGAILIDGKPYQGVFQKAGHFGHTTVDHENEPDVTGMPGSIEMAIGNVTLDKRSLGKFHDTYELLEAYRKGDHFARWIWLTSVRKLAICIAGITNVLSPECVVISGGITEAGKDLFEPLDDFLTLYEWRAGGNKTSIVKAAFGDLAGAIGAACFALSKSS
jgi:glucokinase